MATEKTKRPKAPIKKQTHSIIFQRILIYHIDIDGARAPSDEQRREMKRRGRKNNGIKPERKELTDRKWMAMALRYVWCIISMILSAVTKCD